MHEAGHHTAPKPETDGHGNGEPIIYTVKGTLTGTLTEPDGCTITFSDAAFSWRLVGNTANLDTVLGLSPVPTFEVPAEKDTIRIGSQTLTPTIPTVFAAATVPAPQPFGIAGFSDAATAQGLAWRSPALADYDGISPVHGLAVAFDNAGPLPANRGELSITGASDLRFSAVVV
jgi:hypothetical protein